MLVQKTTDWSTGPLTSWSVCGLHRVCSVAALPEQKTFDNVDQETRPGNTRIDDVVLKSNNGHAAFSFSLSHKTCPALRATKMQKMRKQAKAWSYKMTTLSKWYARFPLYLLFRTVVHFLLILAAHFEAPLHTIYRFGLLGQQFVLWTCQTLHWIKGAELLILTERFNVISGGASKRKVANILGRWRLLVVLVFLLIVWMFSETVWSHHWPVKYQT